MKLSILAGLLLSIGLSNTAYAATAIKSSEGLVTGVNGIVVGTNRYDVTFSDTWKAELIDLDLDLANDLSYALFTSYADNRINGFQFTYENPVRIAGCNLQPTCGIRTIFDTTQSIYYIDTQETLYYALGQQINVEYGLSISATYLGGYPIDYWLTSIETPNPRITYANWKLSVSPVPEPPTLLLFTPALLGFIGFRRKIQKLAEEKRDIL